jgi:hypothetical protein
VARPLLLSVRNRPHAQFRASEADTGARTMKITSFVLFTSLLASACSDNLEGFDVEGSLSLSLSTVAGGVPYRLRDGHFRLAGPVERELESGDEASLVVSLPPGMYTLSLLEGYSLTRENDASAEPVSARLVSQNPAQVMVNAGQTARLTFRFELAPQSQVGAGSSANPADASGTLSIDLAVNVPDAGPPPPKCEATLRIEEVDYEQAGSDETEFVELINASTCTTPLEGLALEFVNGGDGKVYGRYDLGAAGANWPAGARLVVGDANILSALPAGTISLMLNGSGLQNGPDAVRLVRAERVLDALLYEGAVPGVSGTPTAADEAESSLGRCAGTEGFRLAAPSPGVANVCE